MRDAPKSNILLIDDEIDYLIPLAKRLRKRDFNVFIASNGYNALEQLEIEEIDCVVLDIKMPGMEGNQVLEEIKKRIPIIEVIMLTGHVDINIAMEVMELGAIDYLTKPIDFDDLLCKLRNALKKKKINEEKLRHEQEQREEESTN